MHVLHAVYVVVVHVVCGGDGICGGGACCACVDCGNGAVCLCGAYMWLCGGGACGVCGSCGVFGTYTW